MALLIFGLLAVCGCESDLESAGAPTTPSVTVTQSNEPTPELITEAEALASAAAFVPDSIAGQASLSAERSGGLWLVSSAFYRNVYSFEELGWPEDSNVELKNYGLLAEGNFRLLVFEVDAATGDVLHRIVSDSLSMAEAKPASINPACGGCG